MTVFKTQRGKWRAQHNRVSIGTFDTKREAKQAEADYLAANGVGSTPQRMTVAELQDRWLRVTEPTVRESTLRHYRMNTAKLVQQHGAMQVRAFGVRHAEDWNLEHHWTIDECKRMFLYAVKIGVIRESPWRTLTKRPGKRQLKSGWITLDGVNALAAAAEAHGTYHGANERGLLWRALVLTSAWTGIRPGEAFGLRLADVNFDSGLVTVARSVDGKTGVVDLTKNGEERTIVIPPPALDAIQASLPGRRVLWPGWEPVPLFPNQSGKVLRQGSWGPRWRVVRAAAGFDGMDFYELRHFAATQLLEAGVSVEDVAHQLGHSDGGRLVAKVYGHPDERFTLERISAAMGRLAA